MLSLAGSSHARASDDMIWIPGGTFRMGSDHHYSEEAPAHRITVTGLWIDRTPVTSRQFSDFVASRALWLEWRGARGYHLKELS
jgi:formylglycine-generating enzyme required for sulfatase activity